MLVLLLKSQVNNALGAERIVYSKIITPSGCGRMYGSRTHSSECTSQNRTRNAPLPAEPDGLRTRELRHAFCGETDWGLRMWESYREKGQTKKNRAPPDHVIPALALRDVVSLPPSSR